MKHSGRPPVSVGHIDITPLPTIASAIHDRLRRKRYRLMVYIGTGADEGEVFATRDDSAAAARFPIDEPERLIGVYGSDLDPYRLLDDLQDARDQRADRQQRKAAA